MPFAQIRGLIARFRQPNSQRRLVERQGAIVRKAARLRGVFARLQARPRWPTHWLTGESPFKAHALGCHLIQIWRNGQTLAITAACVPALLIGKENNDMGVFRHKTLLNPVK